MNPDENSHYYCSQNDNHVAENLVFPLEKPYSELSSSIIGKKIWA